MKQDNIVIYNSKRKLFLSMLICLVFIGASVWLLSIEFDDQVVHWIAYGFIAFFGLILMLIGIRFLDDKPGLIIDNEGIHQQSPVSRQSIFWKDIKSIETIKEQGQRFVLVDVQNPQEYLDGATGVTARFMKLNEQMYGTPLSLSSNGLKCSHGQLVQMLEEWLEGP